MTSNEIEILKKYITERANHATHGSSIDSKAINSQSDSGNIRPDLILQNKGYIDYHEYNDASGNIICNICLDRSYLKGVDYKNIINKLKNQTLNAQTDVFFENNGDLVIQKKFEDNIEIKQWVNSLVRSLNGFFVNLQEN